MILSVGYQKEHELRVSDKDYRPGDYNPLYVLHSLNLFPGPDFIVHNSENSFLHKKLIFNSDSKVKFKDNWRDFNACLFGGQAFEFDFKNLGETTKVYFYLGAIWSEDGDMLMTVASRKSKLNYDNGNHCDYDLDDLILLFSHKIFDEQYKNLRNKLFNNYLAFFIGYKKDIIITDLETIFTPFSLQEELDKDIEGLSIIEYLKFTNTLGNNLLHS